MWKWGEKKRQRLMHNERCRRYYQRHLSKKAKEKRAKEEARKERARLKAESLRNGGNGATTHEDNLVGHVTKNDLL